MHGLFHIIYFKIIYVRGVRATFLFIIDYFIGKRQFNRLRRLHEDFDFNFNNASLLVIKIKGLATFIIINSKRLAFVTLVTVNTCFKLTIFIFCDFRLRYCDGMNTKICKFGNVLKSGKFTNSQTTQIYSIRFFVFLCLVFQ